jgi:hypothetical protein
MTLVMRFFERADECRREAAQATNAADVVAWLSLADQWRQLGQDNNAGAEGAEPRHRAFSRAVGAELPGPV